MLHLSTSNLSGQKLLRKAFHRMHKVFLKKYEAYAGFDEVFTSGHYDCLTATALFSRVLEQLNYPCKIIETNYHIFLMVQTAEGNVLLETTDRFTGFITGEEAIASRTNDYQKNILAGDHSKVVYYQYAFNLYQQISAEKLNGLLYFNQAVKAYNHHEWIASACMLQKADVLYPSQRCEELGALLIQTILAGSPDEKTKEVCLTHLKNFWTRKSRVVASN